MREGRCQRLLHDPERRKVDARWQVSRFAFDDHLDRQPSRLHLFDQPAELLSRLGCGASAIASSPLRSMPTSRRISSSACWPVDR